MNFSTSRRAVLAALGLAVAAGADGAAAQEDAGIAVEIATRAIPHFRLASAQTRFGALDFVGGFAMRSSQNVFGQLSSFRFLSAGADFVGVADHGYSFFGTIERDGAGMPVGVSDFRMKPVKPGQARSDGDKHFLDVEGLDVDGDVATMAFERDHRVMEYRLGADGVGEPLRELEILIPENELRYNRGLETVARAPDESHLEGARIIVAERSIDENGDLFAAVLEGPGRGIFKVARRDGFDVTDGVFLPGGDLLLLERRFNPSLGVAMRIRRIAGADIGAGALVDGVVLIEADLAHQIDNIEAIDVWRRGDGATVVSLMSDDNQSFLQRSLYLEFILPEG